jgi:hypothetical protein
MLRSTMMRRLVGGAALASIAIGTQFLVPSAAGAHCLPGDIHMNGQLHCYYAGYCVNWTCEDNGCNSIGTTEQRCDCVAWTDACGGIQCIEEYCYYNCDGC